MQSTADRAIRARAPLRLGLAGGGTDLSPYCDEFGGIVLNIAIDRFAFASIQPRTDGKIVFQAKDLGREEVLPVLPQLPNAELALHRGVYERMVRDYNGGQPLPVTIVTSVDAPLGSGLGASSALVVALVDAFRALLGAPLGQYEIAQLAFEIERIDLGLAGGRQDQYAAAFGGVNFIEFFANNRAIVNPLRVSTAILNELECSLVVCFSGRTRDTNAIIGEQAAGLSKHLSPAITGMDRLKADTIDMKRALLAGDIEEMARILGHSWQAKRMTAVSVSNERVDQLLRLALDHGALAGKLSGAGGGGFMMFLVPPEDRLALITALREEGGVVAESVKFVERGSETWRAP
jgi:D-glycero-alpha-D-manno-heptose-7-phosphate kinase